MLCQLVGEGPLDIDRETTSGRAASTTTDAARLSPMQQSDVFCQSYHDPDTLLSQCDSSIPCLSRLAGKSKTQPHTWSIEYIDYEKVHIDAEFDRYMGSIGHAHETRIEADDDNIGLPDADLTFDDEASVLSSPDLDKSSTATASTSPLSTDDTDSLEDDDLAHTIATMEIHRLTSPCSVGCQPVCPSAAVFSDPDLLTRVTDTIDPGTRALNGMEIKVLEFKLTAIAVYKMMKKDDPKSLLHYDKKTYHNIHAHVDGGAQASTTNCEEIIWCIEWLSHAESLRIRLKVADNNVHHPVARGYVKVPLEGGKFKFVRIYFTPSLPVTILSPSDMAKEHGCAGYSSVSFFDGQASSVDLLHCRRRSQNIHIPVTLQAGLLFSQAIIPPTTDERKLSRLPRSTLHADIVDTPCTSSVPSCSPGGCPCASGSCTIGSNDSSMPVPPSELQTFAEKTLFFQRLGYQSDVSLEKLHQAADGIPAWPADSPLVCGVCVDSSECSTPDPAGVPDPAPTPAGVQVPAPVPAGVQVPAPVPADAKAPASPPAGRTKKVYPRPMPAPIASGTPLRSLVNSPEYAQQLFAPDNRSYLFTHQLTRDQQRILWHQRLGHMHSRRISDLHKYSVGVPKLPIATELEKCPICLHAKLRHANKSLEDSRRALQPCQGISADFAFLVQKSSDPNRLQRLAGLNGETCYCLIVDHKTKTLYGECFASKGPPVDFINRWLARHGLPVQAKDKYVRFDLGGEMGKSPEIVRLFERAGYSVEPTAPHSSHQNGPGERPHQTISDAIRTMLAGADLAPKFWPYAFHHFLRLYNVTVHGTDTASPYEQMTGKKPDLSLLRVFGCRLYALPARPRRPDKALSDSRTGIFLGFTKTMRNVLYYDTVSELVKTTQHCAFDEAMNDLAHGKKPPNARLLDGIRTGETLDYMGTDTYSSSLEVVATPFTALDSITVTFDPSEDHPIGLEYAQCSKLDRAFISDVHSSPVGHRARTFMRKYKGSYIVSVANTPVFTPDDIDKVLITLSQLDDPPLTLTIVLAPERATELNDDRMSPLNLRLHDLRRICALQSIDGTALNQADYAERLNDYANSLSDTAVTELIARLQTNDMTPEEQRLKRFTRRSLQKLSNWSVWDEAFDAQLDQQHKDGTIGLPIPRPAPIDGRPPSVLRSHWSNLVKTDGRRKARLCLDGSKKSAPWLRDLASTYASCISQPCMRLFFAIAAAESMTVTFGDTTNAFQQAPAPTEKCYLTIDDAYMSWYKKRHGSPLDPRTHVIPVHKALQGHPEAGALWERMINDILVKELGFKSTTHERNLYHGKLDGHAVLICRMVDDYAIACRNPSIAEKIISRINDKATTDSLGVGNRFNGVDIVQSRDYIKLHCETYIDRMLQTHGWSHPSPDESDRHDNVPIAPGSIESLQRLEPGPAEGTTAHRVLQDKMKFTYRQVLGELIYAYVVARLDIGYAVTLLARFSQCPTEEHYTALRGVCKYLRRTKDWGIVYWRDKPVTTLPAIPLAAPSVDSSLPDFPSTPLLQLTGFVDAAHATDLATRRSITGLVFTLAGGAIAYKSKLQPTVSTSSTEAEFIAAVHAAKIAKHLRFVMTELGYPPSGPTSIYEDNQAAIAMINEDRPTTRSRHIDIQHFAIQEWRSRGIITMVYIPTTINPADASTKALSWILHSRHVRRAMGHYGVS